MRILLSITTPEAIPAGSILNVVEDSDRVEINVMGVAKCLGVGERKAAPKPQPTPEVVVSIPVPLLRVDTEPFQLSDGKRMTRSVRSGIDVVIRQLQGRAPLSVPELLRAEYGAKSTADDYNHVCSALYRLKETGHVAVEAKKWRWVK